MEKFLTNLWVQTIAVAIRAFLLVQGTAIVTMTHGAVTQDHITQIVGAIMVVLGILWSLGEKFLIAKFLAQFNFFNFKP